MPKPLRRKQKGNHIFNPQISKTADFQRFYKQRIRFYEFVVKSGEAGETPPDSPPGGS